MPRHARTLEGRDVADAILAATAALISTHGTAGTSMAAVARGLGISIRPIRNRYPDCAGLLAQTWQERLWPPLAARIVTLVQCREARDVPGLVAGLRESARRGPDEDATAELILHARFDPTLGDAVALTLGALVTRLTTPASAATASNAFVLALALGLMIGARHERAGSLDLEAALPTWMAAAVTPAAPRPLPEANATHMDDYPVLAPGDPALDILLNTALEMISLRGFHQVTVSQIAHAAGFTEGLAFRRYRSKLDMLQDAIKRQNAAGMALNHEFTEGLQQAHGIAVAEAVIIAQAQKPGREVGRSMALEQVRLGWHHRDLAEAQARSLDEFRAQLVKNPGWASYETETDFFLQFALSWGMYRLPFLNPDVHTLPYDCALVPLYTAFDSRLGSTS